MFPRGLTSRGIGRRVLLSRALPVFLLVVLAVGCASGYVTTSTGAIVPAATVQAQDLTGDALSILQDVHNAAVAAHDAKMATHLAAIEAGNPDAIAGDAEFRKTHAKRRAALLASASGLRAAWDGLSAWKLGSEGAGMAAVVGKVRDALPEMLDAAVALGVVSREYADAIGVFFGTALRGATPAPLKKVPVVSVLGPAEEVGRRAAAQPVAVPAIGREPLGGCTTDDILRGLCVGGCTASIPPRCSYWRIGGLR